MSMVTGNNTIEGLLKLKATHLLQACAIFVISLLILTQLLKLEKDASLASLRADISTRGLNLQARLEDQLAANMHLAEGLAATIIGIPDITTEMLADIIEPLYSNGNHLINIGVAPGNRISNVYPVSGNESALGLYYPDIPDQWPAVKAAISKRTAMLAGPVKLVQGGTGLINRKPVFLEDGSYWGIISLVLDMDSLFSDSGFTAPPEGLTLALFKNEDATNASTYIYGNLDVLKLDPVFLDLHIPGSHWQLALAPTAGWNSSLPSQLPFELLGIFIIFLISIGFLGFRTVINSLKIKDSNMRAILDASRDSILVLNENGYILDANPSTEYLFGYDAKDLIGEPVSNLFNDESTMMDDLFKQNCRFEQLGTSFFELSGKHQRGDEFAMEVSIGLMGSKTSGKYVCVMRDITERKSAETRLIRMASTDPLTNAMNRRAFMIDGEKLFSIAKRFNRKMSVITLDADHFKNINDTYGHDVGDQVLIAIVETLKTKLRRVDLISRFGGEEFMVLLPETDEETAALVAEKLRNSLAALKVSTGDNCILCFTCSLGYTSITDETASLAEMLQQADQALYKAKSDGRNRSLSYSLIRQESVHRKISSKAQVS